MKETRKRVTSYEQKTDGSWVKWVHNDQGYITDKTSSTGERLHKEINDHGNTTYTAQINKNGQLTESFTQYDSQNRMISHREGSKPGSLWAYDHNGNTTFYQSESGRQTKSTYIADGKPLLSQTFYKNVLIEQSSWQYDEKCNEIFYSCSSEIKGVTRKSRYDVYSNQVFVIHTVTTGTELEVIKVEETVFVNPDTGKDGSYTYTSRTDGFTYTAVFYYGELVKEIRKNKQGSHITEYKYYDR